MFTLYSFSAVCVKA